MEAKVASDIFNSGSGIGKPNEAGSVLKHDIQSVNKRSNLDLVKFLREENSKGKALGADREAALEVEDVESEKDSGNIETLAKDLQKIEEFGEDLKCMKALIDRKLDTDACKAFVENFKNTLSATTGDEDGCPFVEYKDLKLYVITKIDGLELCVEYRGNDFEGANQALNEVIDSLADEGNERMMHLQINEGEYISVGLPIRDAFFKAKRFVYKESNDGNAEILFGPASTAVFKEIKQYLPDERIGNIIRVQAMDSLMRMAINEGCELVINKTVKIKQSIKLLSVKPI